MPLWGEKGGFLQGAILPLFRVDPVEQARMISPSQPQLEVCQSKHVLAYLELATSTFYALGPIKPAPNQGPSAPLLGPFIKCRKVLPLVTAPQLGSVLFRAFFFQFAYIERSLPRLKANESQRSEA